MLVALVFILLGGTLLYFGAEWLIKGGAGFGLLLGLSPLMVGLTIVAFGTSAPELVVSISSALRGQGDIAAGNVVGSNICNVGLILGLAALISPVHVQKQLIRRDIPLMVGVCILLVIVLWGGTVPRWQGVSLVLMLVAYVTWSVISARQDPDKAPPSEEVGSTPKSVGLCLLLVVVGLVALVGGSQLFVEGAVRVARLLGMSEAVIGLTIVAIGTSLPELAATVVAALKGESGIALGNVVGSNIFNVLSIIGITSVITPLQAAGITPVDLIVMVGFAIAVWPLATTGNKFNRVEGLGLVLAYAGYLTWLVISNMPTA